MAKCGITKPVANSSCVGLTNDGFFFSTSKEENNNNGLAYEAKKDYTTPTMCGSNGNGAASKDKQYPSSNGNKNTGEATKAPLSIQEKEKPPPYQCIKDHNSKDAGSSHIFSPGVPNNNYEHEGGKKVNKKSVLEVKLNGSEGTAQDGGLSAWLVVFAAFWIFFITVI